MARRVLFLLALPVLGAAALTWPAPAQKPQPAAKPVADARPSVADRLARRIDFPGIDDPDAQLGDALKQLGKESGLAFDVNEAAFNQAGLANLAATPLGRPVPKMKNVTVARVLGKLLDRVRVEGGAAFLVRREAVEITTAAARDAEVWFQNPNAEGGAARQPHLPLVNATFDRKPLGEALKELARQSGMNVVVDVRLAEKAKTPVTARFVNTPLDTAVGLLADMAELKPFVLDNLLYVTTRENADRHEARVRPKLPPGADDAEGGPYRMGNGPGRRAAAPPAGM
jgi:hypothetical protein